MDYSIGEFAKLSGVTIRTLRFYDKKGLLKPSFISESSYRYYSVNDLRKLQIILAMKFLGFSLEDIKYLMKTKNEYFSENLELQLEITEKKIEQMQLMKKTLQKAIKNSFRIDDVVELIRITKMETISKEWAEGFYSKEALDNLKSRNFSQEDAMNAAKLWDDLYADIRTAMKNNVTKEEAKPLVERYRNLISAFTQGNSELTQGLNKLWNSMDSAPPAMKEYYDKNKDVMEFIQKMM